MFRMYQPEVMRPFLQRGGARVSLNHAFTAQAGLSASIMRRVSRLLVALFMAGSMQALAGDATDPQLSVQLSEARPYLQQTVILRLRVSHSPAVSELDVEPLQAADFILERLAGPPRTTRRSGPQQMSTDFVYALTPLSSGTLTVPPLQVRIVQDSTAENGDQAVKRVVSVGSEPVSLEVLPLPGDADALLPLYALDVALRVNPRQRLQVGQPFELSIVQQAAGASGERMSDAAALLEPHPDFRIYPGQSRTSGRLTRNGQLLQGQRIDTLTLVPLRDGQLQLPSLALPWWDISRGHEARASWQAMPLQVWPEPGSVTAEAAVTPPSTGSGVALWQVITAMVLAFAGGWWLRGCYRPGETPGVGRLPRWTGMPGHLRQRAQAVWQRRPVRVHNRLRRLRHAKRAATGRTGVVFHRQAETVGRVVAQLPKPLAPWLETARLRKHLEAATGIAELRQCLLAWGSEVLGLPAHTTLMALGRTLARAYPKVDGTRISRLLAELDAALYGAARSPNLVAWKQAFMEELGHVGMRKPYHVSPQRHHGLPVLNPG